MTFDPMSVEVTCVTLPKDHCVQVPWQYINVCGYSDQFCKIPHTYTYILHTTYTYYIQNEWSHSLLLNSVQARQLLNSVQARQLLNSVQARQKGKVENWKWKEEKLKNEEKTFIYFILFYFILFYFILFYFILIFILFYFIFSLFKTLKFVLGLPKWEFSTRKKIRKNDFAPSEKHSSYAPDTNYI